MSALFATPFGVAVVVATVGASGCAAVCCGTADLANKEDQDFFAGSCACAAAGGVLSAVGD